MCEIFPNVRSIVDSYELLINRQKHPRNFRTTETISELFQLFQVFISYKMSIPTIFPLTKQVINDDIKKIRDVPMSKTFNFRITLMFKS